MTARSIIQLFDNYQKERLAFVHAVADLALRPQNVELLEEANVLDLLRPLLSDVCLQVQHCAVTAIGRMAQASSTASRTVLNGNFLPVLLCNIDKQNKMYKKSVLFVLRAICKHDTEMAEYITNNGGLEAIILCLEDFEPIVKENAAWAIGYIARHNQSLAQRCVDAGAVPLLTLCLQEPELNLKQIATNALSDIAKHSVDMAQSIIDACAIPLFAKSLSNQDEKLKRLVLTAMSSCAKHSTELAEAVVEAEVFPSVLLHLAHACPKVKMSAAILVRDIVKHSLELTQLVVNTGGIGALMEVLNQTGDSYKSCKIPCITALGYIAGHSDQIALSVLGCKGVITLAHLLNESTDDATLCVVAWALGQIGKHSPEHANAVAAANAFPRLVELYQSADSSEDLKHKCKITLKQCLQKCLLMSALEPLLHCSLTGIIKYVLGQYTKVLPNDPKARRLFVTSGCLKKVQEIEAEPGSTLMEYITLVNACFPEEIVRYYSPGYFEPLLEKVEQYSPQLMAIFHEAGTRESDTQADLAVYLDKSMSRTQSQDVEAVLKGQRA